MQEIFILYDIIQEKIKEKLKMDLKIYIVRHGETMWNKEGKMQGQLDSKLSEKGIEQAKKLSEKLKDINFEKVYSSVSSRAVETARILVGEREYKIEKSELIKEINMGIWQGMAKKEVLEKYGDNNYRFWNAPHIYDHIINKGESFEELKKRAVRFIEEIVEKHNNGNILLVSHGVTIKAILSSIEKKTIEEFWDGQFILNTSLSLITHNKDTGYKIEKTSDISHLD